jgi:hypothetical protein
MQCPVARNLERVGEWWSDQRHASAAATTKSDTFYGADPQCANMFRRSAAALTVHAKKSAIIPAVLATA